MSQRVVVDQLLPIVRADVEDSRQQSTVDYLYEPSAQQIFNLLLPRYVEVQIYQALLESNAAFFAAQMTAMDTATKNSADMIASLTLYMNKVRQAGDHARDHRSCFRRGSALVGTHMAENVGHIVQVIGPVIDVEFEAGHLPEIYNALRVVSDGQGGRQPSTSSQKSSSTRARTAFAPLR